MNKKLFAFFTALFFCCQSFLSPAAALTPNAPAAPPFDVPAKSAVLLDVSTGTVLYEKNAHAKIPPASITKIMTMILVMEAIDQKKLSMNDPITASTHASKMGGSQIWLKENEEMSVHDLLKAVAIASANDAATALAEQIGGSEEGFVAMMNHKASSLGMKDTVFQNPTGLDAKGHVSSAYDVALMSRELLKHSGITDFTSTWMDSLRNGKTELVNTNKLVRFYKGCIGIKTGTTDEAGSCLSAAADRNGMRLIAVIMGAKTSAERFSSARTLLDYGFSHYVTYTPPNYQKKLSPVNVTGGVSREVPLFVDAPKQIILPKGKEKSIKEEIDILDSVGAPVEKGQALGEIRLKIDGKEIARFPVTAKRQVKKLYWPRAFCRLFTRLVTLH